MNNPGSPLETPTFVVDYPLQAGHDPAHCLIVLIPPSSDSMAATHKIWELAIPLEAQVLLLGLCKDAEQELGLRRQLVTMASLLEDGKVSTELKIEYGTNWVQAVKRNYQAGAVIVCFAEQRTGLFQRPLSQILQSDLDAPLYILSELYPQNDPASNGLAQAAVWIGSIAIIAGFFVLQTRISLLTDWSQTILMLLSTAVEVWAIWIWNSLLE